MKNNFLNKYWVEKGVGGWKKFMLFIYFVEKNLLFPLSLIVFGVHNLKSCFNWLRSEMSKAPPSTNHCAVCFGSIMAAFQLSTSNWYRKFIFSSKNKAGHDQQLTNREIRTGSSRRRKCWFFCFSAVSLFAQPTCLLRSSGTFLDGQKDTNWSFL